MSTVRAYADLFRMGHCAPSVMSTVGSVAEPGKDWLVKLAAGMPGGIGNTGHECGALTSPLVLLGMRHGLRDVDRGLPVVFDRSHALCQRFLTCNRTLHCAEIRGNTRFPRHCIPPVVRSPRLFADVVARDAGGAIAPDARLAYARLYAHLTEHDFHCARAVFRHLGDRIPLSDDLENATSAFLGGTAFMGLTCSAFTAGVMALGLELGEVENSLPRVVRMLAIMTAGGDALRPHLNRFNPSLMRGYRLSRWFAREFGSTLCSELTHCDFATAAGVDDYIASGRLGACQSIARQVAGKVREMLVEEAPP